MSITNHLMCEDCNIRVWIGQSDYIYTGKEDIDKLEAFLFNHVNHKLVFVGDSMLGDSDPIDAELRDNIWVRADEEKTEEG